MYPQPPQFRHRTNQSWVLIACMGAMLIVLFAGLRTIAAHLADASAQPITIGQPSPRVNLAAQVSAAPPTVASAEVTAQPSSAVLDVDAKVLTESPANYRSRVVRVRGTVFYTGKLADGKAWIQIVADDNVYVDGQADSLPAGVTKGTQVAITGIGAGLTNVTASNGKDYDQAYIDPIQTIEVLTS